MEFDTLSDIKGIAPPTDTTFLEIQGEELPRVDGLDFDEDPDDQAINMAGYPGPEESSSPDTDRDSADKPAKRQRRRRRRGRGTRSNHAGETPDDAPQNQADEPDSQAETGEQPESEPTESQDSATKKKPRRRRRGGRGRKKQTDSGDPIELADGVAQGGDGSLPKPHADQSSAEGASDTAAAKKKRRSSSRKKKSDSPSATQNADDLDTLNPSDPQKSDGSGDAKPKRPRRRRPRGSKTQTTDKAVSQADSTPQGTADAPTANEPAPKPVTVKVKPGGYTNHVIEPPEPVQEPS